MENLEVTPEVEDQILFTTREQFAIMMVATIVSFAAQKLTEKGMINLIPRLRRS